MTDSKINNNSPWQNLDLEWTKKVQICQQGMANGDSVLLTLVIMFVAVEGILITILVGVGWGKWWSIILAFAGVVFIIFYTWLFKTRGDKVDCWGKKLHKLWGEAGQPELAKQYNGCVERRNRGKWKVIFGWCETDEHMGRFKRIKSWFKPFGSTRRWFTTWIPLGIVIVWILLMFISLVCQES